MARYKKDYRESELFTTGSLEGLLPAGSPARTVWAAVGLLDFSAFDEGYANDGAGASAVDPRRLTAVWVLALMRGVTSSVQLAEACERDVELRWLLGGGTVRKSTLCAFRKDHLERLSGLCAQTLSAMAGAGLLPGAETAVDGTVIRAASACGSVRKRKDVQKAVRRLERAIEEKLAEPDCEDGEAGALERQKAKLEGALAAMKDMGLTQDDAMNVTEPDASRKRLKNGAFAPAYNAQVVTDTSSGAIIHAEVVDRKNDSGQLAPQLERAIEALDAAGAGPIKAVAADSAYHDAKQLAQLEASGIAAFVPNDRNDNRRPRGVGADFAAGAFAYDEIADAFQCPAGAALRRRKRTGESITYQAQAADCSACPHKPRCCPNTQAGRSVNRSIHAPLLQTIAQRNASPEGKRMSAKRRTTAEGAFARIKEQLHWDRCRTWGQRGAQAELLWRQLAHNLLLLIGHWKPLAMT